jgi:hypothetical protein
MMMPSIMKHVLILDTSSLMNMDRIQHSCQL